MPALVNVLPVKKMLAMGYVGMGVTVGIMCVVIAAGTKVVLATTHAAGLIFIKSVVWFLIIFTVMNRMHAKSCIHFQVQLLILS